MHHMSKFFNTLRRPFSIAIISIAFLFAFAVLLPHILQRFESEYPFQGIEILGTDSEGHYTSRVREVYDGHWKVANVTSATPKDQPYLQPPLPEISMAVVGMLFGVKAPQAVVLSKAYLSFILVFLMVGFFAALTGRPWESLLAVSALLFVQPLLGAPWDLAKWLFDTAEMYPPLRYSRPVSPLWHAPWTFGALWLIASWIRGRCTYKMILGGVCTAVLLYSYIFAWTFIGSVMTMLLIFYIYKRDKKRVRDMFLFALVFFLLALPYLFNVWGTMHHPDYADAAMRFGFVPMRAPMWSLWGLLFLILSFGTRRFFQSSWPLAPAIAIGGLLALNEHVFTGTYIMNHHYYWYFVGPISQAFSVLVLLMFCSKLMPVSQSLRKGSVVLLLLLAVTFGIRQQALAYRGQRVFAGEMQSVASALTFIDTEIPCRSVVLPISSRELYDYLITYTCAELTGANGVLYIKNSESLRDALFLDLWISGLMPEEASERFFTDLRLYLSTGIYSIYYRELLGSGEMIPDSEIAKHLEAYKEYYELSVQKKLERTPVDYILLESDLEISDVLKSLINGKNVIYDEGEYRVVSL